jgi:hypothetical protein
MELKKKKYHNLSVSCQLDLFDKVVKPIVLYGSEVWGFRNYHMVEQVHLQFCKLLLKLKLLLVTVEFMVNYDVSTIC